MSRIGVFVCWCRSSIAERVNVQEVAGYGATLPGVVKSIRALVIGAGISGIQASLDIAVGGYIELEGMALT